MGLPEPGDRDRRRMVVYDLKYSARDAKGRKSNLRRYFYVSVEPFPVLRANKTKLASLAIAKAAKLACEGIPIRISST
jgi:hypothetical protein